MVQKSTKVDNVPTLKFIYNFQVEKGYCPTVEEIANFLGKVKSVANRRIDILEELGLLSREKYNSRTIHLTAAGYRKIGVVPLHGYKMEQMLKEIIKELQNLD